MTKGDLAEIPVWFPGARLNYAENLLWRNDDAIACTAGNEMGRTVHYSFRELGERVRCMASAMRANGLVVGDRVAGMSIVTTPLSSLTSYFWLRYRYQLHSCSYDCSRYRQYRCNILKHCNGHGNSSVPFYHVFNSKFSQQRLLQGILDRYRQIQPKLVFAETEVFYAGKTIDLLPKVAEVIQDLSKRGLRRAILLPSTISGKELKAPDTFDA